MRNHLKNFLLCVALTVLGTVTTFAQATLKGKIVDAETNEPLIGATVSVSGTSQGTVTDIDGLFEFSLKTSKATLVFSYVGYNELRREIKANGGSVNLGEIQMKPNVIGLEEVSVIGSIIKSDRQTPIPISNVKLAAIQEKMGNKEFPEILKSTPSVYATRNSGGYGDSRINMRGFGSDNLGVLVNGVPVNDMENGKVYFSNWAGLTDVTQFIQVQRGLGASALGISSAGGTINIATKTTDAKRGGTAYMGVGNDGYRKYAVSFSTGLMDNGWSVTVMGSLNTGDGYVKGTNYEGWTYFGNITKVLNEHHKIALTAFGSPQWHNKRAIMNTIEDVKNSPDKARLNKSYGIINGEIVGGSYGYNFYHKPQVSLNHYWTINEQSSLTTSAYASISTGGGRKSYGEHKNWLALDNTTGKPYAETRLTPDGLLDYDAVMKDNAASVNGSQAIFVNSVNDHKWFGLLSSYKNRFTEELTFTGGFDGRYYRGYHGQKIDDLLGGEYFMEKPGKQLDFYANNAKLKEGDYVGYYNIGEVFWAGIFGQAEYNTDRWSAFLSGSLTEESYRFRNPGKALDGKTVSSFQNFLPWSVKGGFNYKFNENHNAYFNAGYFTRAPYFNNAFLNHSIVKNDGAKYEKIMTFELGYGFSNEYLNVALNGYYTKWMDKALVKRIQDETANITGLDAIHMGVELEATYKPVRYFELKGMFSYGDWKWADDVNFTLYNDRHESLGEFNAYLKDVHVGNSAQMTGSLSASWKPFKGFKLHVDYTYAGKNYADFDPSYRTKQKDAGVDAWKLPDFYTIDLGCSYHFDLCKGLKAAVYTNIDNLTNVSYIADAKDGYGHDWQSALVYYGFGTTWSTGFKVMF